MSDDQVYLSTLMRDFFDQNSQWPKFTYGDKTTNGVVYVYHNSQLLALLSDSNIVIRVPGSYFNYCGTKVAPLFDRFLPEHPEFFVQVSNAIDIAIRLIESGKTEFIDGGEADSTVVG